MLRMVTIGHLINLALAWLDNKLADLRGVLAHAFQRLRPVKRTLLSFGYLRTSNEELCHKKRRGGS